MRARGFTLIELVVAIAITAIVASFIAMFMTTPVTAYDTQSKRMSLTDSADSVLRGVAREVRRSLPNSVRVAVNGTVTTLEFIDSIDAVRYRSSGALGDPTQELDFATADAAFATLGKFSDIVRPYTTSSNRLVIYNVGQPGADAYESANVITPTGTTITIQDGAAGEDRVTLSSAFRFAYGSPGRRVYLITGPVSYLCDTANGTLRRYSGYTLAPSQTARDSDAELMAAGASRSLVAEQLSSCSMTYTAGVAQRAGLVTLAMTVQNGNERERLLHQVHVENVP